MFQLGQYATFGRYTVDDVFPYICWGREPNEIKMYRGDDGRDYPVTMSSLRYHVFKNSQVCDSCGRVGTVMLLQCDKVNYTEDFIPKAHFNLYAIDEDGTFVLMTKDHIVPFSVSKNNSLNNLQTMCAYCNSDKANKNISNDELQNHPGMFRPRDNEGRLLTKDGVLSETN